MLNTAGRLTALQALRLEDCSAAGTRGGRFTDAGLAHLASCTLLLEVCHVLPVKTSRLALAHTAWIYSRANQPAVQLGSHFSDRAQLFPASIPVRNRDAIQSCPQTPDTLRDGDTTGCS